MTDAKANSKIPEMPAELLKDLVEIFSNPHPFIPWSIGLRESKTPTLHVYAAFTDIFSWSTADRYYLTPNDLKSWVPKENVKYISVCEQTVYNWKTRLVEIEKSWRTEMSKRKVKTLYEEQAKKTFDRHTKKNACVDIDELVSILVIS